MALVIDSLFALVLIIAALWIASVMKSAGADRNAAAQTAQAQAERERLLAREDRLQTPGLPLQCMQCGTRFAGPLDAGGCPQCHVGAFVVPEEEVNHVHNAAS